jgi:hypothetical protein
MKEMKEANDSKEKKRTFEITVGSIPEYKIHPYTYKK